MTEQVGQQAESHRIVVGIDGSEPSKAALAWAVGQAKRTGASVEAVIAWHFPVVVGGMPFAPVSMLENADFGGQAASLLRHVIAETVPSDSAVKISTTVREGNAAQILLEVADGADLLVVGSRGHGGFAEALLGSVSQHCVHHARCPIVIIRGQGEPTA